MIRTEKLSMYYGRVHALRGIDFQIERGKIVGLLGPNGAGKSTTLKIITGYLYPSQGTAYVGGKDVRDCLETRKMIGYLPEQLPLYMDMEVRKYLDFVGRARSIERKNLKKRLSWVMEKCGLKPVYTKLIRELSKGYKQRTGLAQALLHDPKIVILDEPTSGLDPHQIVEIRNLVHELAESGKTVIFSTHILQEVQAVTQNTIIINQGQIVAQGSIDDLRSKIRDHMVCELVLDKEIQENEVKNEIGSLSEVAWISDAISQEGQSLYRIQGHPNQELRLSLGRFLQKKNWKFLELKKRAPDLEEIFLTLTKEPESKT